MTNTANTNSGGGATSPSLLQSVIGNVCISLGMCTFYLCGATNNNKQGQSEDERQKEMDATFLGRIITCDMAHCYDCDGYGAMDDADISTQ